MSQGFDATVPAVTEPSGILVASPAELEALETDVKRAVEMLKKFYGDDAAGQAAKLEERLKGSVFAQRVSEALKA